MGGIGIQTQYSSASDTQFGNCSYSIPAVRNVFWWTETGFVTAGHCFHPTFHSGNDVWQPTRHSGKIGDLTAYKYETRDGECDCAFVKSTGSKSAWFGAYDGANRFQQLAGKTDPLLNSYVILVGQSTGINLGKVVHLSHESNRENHVVENTVRIDWHSVERGDSGGIVYDWLTESQYNGLISAHTSGGDSVAIPWSHVKAGLNLR